MSPLKKYGYRTSSVTVAKVDDDVVVICCDGAGFVDGFVQHKVPVRHHIESAYGTQREDRYEQRWCLPVYAGGSFKLKHFIQCPWCGFTLPRDASPQ
jgi:hypothetical protein